MTRPKQLNSKLLNGLALTLALALGSMVSATDCLNENETSFRNDVLPVLSKLGCNSGACHGALAGKGGFRLSLHGYDPESDYFNIAKQARGRRLELADPGRSLILTKPLGVLPHKGGVRLNVDSEAFRQIANWIQQGAPAPEPSDKRVEHVEIEPAESILSLGREQTLKVVAHFDDGSQQDVTQWAKLTSTDQTIAQVTEDGRVEVIGYGEGAVTAWYSSKIGVARITSPFASPKTDRVVGTPKDTRNLEYTFIDRLVNEQLRRLNIPASRQIGPGSFVRRIYLDTIGRLPTAEERSVYTNDKSPDRREKLIESLLSKSEFVDYWTYQWSDLLLINGRRLRPKAVEAFYKWLKKEVQDNTPWDQLVRKIITAKGSSVANGATNFYALHQDPENMAENASQAFLGLSIGCAKCHNHPLEKWTNDQYYAFANHFSRVRAKGWGGDSRNGDGVRSVFIQNQGELIQPIRGVPQPPTPLDGEPIDFDYAGDRREPLAKWMTAPENPYFARSISNRIWAKFLGVGLVESVDDMRMTNPASNEILLNALANHLIENEFDLKQLMRVILSSATYSRSSQPIAGNEKDFRFYSHYYPRRLMAEVLLDAISDVTDVPTKFNKIAFPGADIRATKFYPPGTRAIQLYDSAVVSYFLKSFGRNQREITCECQRSDEPSMVQVLHISNGDTMNSKLEAVDNWIKVILAQTPSDSEAIRQAYLRALCRYPTTGELNKVLKAFGNYQSDQRRKLFEDLLWGLMSSREFLFNH